MKQPPRSPFERLSARLSRHALATAALALASQGCVSRFTLGSDDHDVAPGDGSADGASEVFGDAGGDVASETALEAGDAGDTGNAADANSDAGCTFVSGAADYWVDARASGPSVGTATCPFKTIREATSLAPPASGRVIHVAGGAPMPSYDEAGPVVVAANVVLRAEGGAAQIQCVSGCVYSDGSVLVEGGGTLDGFTVTTPASGGATYGVKVGPATAIPPAVVRRVTATKCARYGVLTDGSIELGPDVKLVGNVASGLYSGGGGTQFVRVVGTGNAFDQNGGNGLTINASKLVVASASASKNGGHGVLLEGYPTETSTIDGLVATDNGGDGLRAIGQFTSLRLGTSRLLRNAGFGVRFGYGVLGASTRNALEVSQSTLGAAGADRNARGSLCLEQSAPTLTVPSSVFAACPPTQLAVVGCDAAAPASYRDVWYVPRAAGDPVDATACSVGP